MTKHKKKFRKGWQRFPTFSGWDLQKATFNRLEKNVYLRLSVRKELSDKLRIKQGDLIGVRVNHKTIRIRKLRVVIT